MALTKQSPMNPFRLLMLVATALLIFTIISKFAGPALGFQGISVDAGFLWVAVIIGVMVAFMIIQKGLDLDKDSILALIIMVIAIVALIFFLPDLVSEQAVARIEMMSMLGMG